MIGNNYSSLQGFGDFLAMVIRFEIGGKDLYNSRYTGVIWPGEQSGATIGIGYDLGYVSQNTFKNDWYSLIDQNSINLLSSLVGLKKGQARDAVAAFNKKYKVYISYDAALRVYQRKKVPQKVNQTRNLLPGLDQKYPYSFFAMVSCIFNRGAGISGDSRVEMLNIHNAVTGKIKINKPLPSFIAEQLRSMKRLWPDMKGLRDRREVQACFAERDLS